MSTGCASTLVTRSTQASSAARSAEACLMPCRNLTSSSCVSALAHPASRSGSPKSAANPRRQAGIDLGIFGHQRVFPGPGTVDLRLRQHHGLGLAFVGKPIFRPQPVPLAVRRRQRIAGHQRCALAGPLPEQKGHCRARLARAPTADLLLGELDPNRHGLALPERHGAALQRPVCRALVQNLLAVHRNHHRLPDGPPVPVIHAEIDRAAHEDVRPRHRRHHRAGPGNRKILDCRRERPESLVEPVQQACVRFRVDLLRAALLHPVGHKLRLVGLRGAEVCRLQLFQRHLAHAGRRLRRRRPARNQKRAQGRPLLPTGRPFGSSRCSFGNRSLACVRLSRSARILSTQTANGTRQRPDEASP